MIDCADVNISHRCREELKNVLGSLFIDVVNQGKQMGPNFSPGDKDTEITFVFAMVFKSTVVIEGKEATVIEQQRRLLSPISLN